MPEGSSLSQSRNLFCLISIFSDIFRLCQAFCFSSCAALFDDLADLAVGRLVEAVFFLIEQAGDQHEEERNDGHHQQQAGLLPVSDLADHGVDGCGLCGGVDFALIGLLLVGGNLIRVVQHAARDIGEGGDADDDG